MAELRDIGNSPVNEQWNKPPNATHWAFFICGLLIGGAILGLVWTLVAG